MRSKTIFWALLALSAFVLFFRLGSYGLVETSDARYAETAAEMYRTGDYLTPFLNGVKYFRKPPLIYWTSLPGLALAGVNEWGARLTLGFTALATLWLTFALARRLYGVRAGLTAWVVLLGMGGFLGTHRLLTADPLLTLTMTGALYAFWRWREEGRPLFSHLFFACLGLAMMTKGPVGVAVTWLIVLAWALADRRLRELARLRWGAGGVIFALVGMSWYVYVVARYGGLLHSFLFGQAARVSGELGHVEPFWFIAAMFAAYCLPWTPFLAVALWRAPRAGSGEGGRGAHLFLAAWVLVPVVFFSLPATKLPSYILPSLPAAAVLLAGWWQAQVDRGGLTQGGRLAAAALAIILFVYPVLLVIRPNIIPGMEPLARGVAVLSLAAAALCAAGALRARPWPALLGAAALLPAVMLLTGLQIERVPLKTYRPLALLVAQARREGASVATYQTRLYGLPFYVGGAVEESGVARDWQYETDTPGIPVTPRREFVARWPHRGRSYCILPESRLSDFRGLAYRVLARHRRLVLITNDTVTNDTVNKDAWSEGR